LSPKMCEIRAPSLYFFLRLVSQVLPLWWIKCGGLNQYRYSTQLSQTWEYIFLEW
jgi:hypothetical protein